MKKYIQDSLELLRSMVRTPSPSFEEKAVSDLIFNALSSWGMQPVRYGLNIVCTSKSYNPSKKTLVLDAHMDTVPPAASYTNDPYNPDGADDTIFGLGSSDDGGSLVAMAAAFRQFNEQVETSDINLVLAISVQEEKSGPDGAVLLYSENGPAEVRDADWVIVGEPTGLRAATSERGLLVIDGYAHGVSGHAARNEGVNALYAAIEDIAKLRAHSFARISPRMGKVGLNVTQIEAGTAHNVIPDSCHFVVDIRPTEQYTNEDILVEVQSLCGSELKARNLMNRSSATFAGSPLLSAVESLGIQTFSSPTTSNWMRTGKDAIKIGPGESSRSHKADEYILCSEVEKGVETYLKLINEIAKCQHYGTRAAAPQKL